MQADFSKVLIDLDGTDALEPKYDKANPTKEPRLVPLTVGSAVMRALNTAEAPETEKMDRYEIIKKIRANPGAVDLTESEPEMVRAAVQKVWPAFVYGQVCETLNLK